MSNTAAAFLAIGFVIGCLIITQGVLPTKVKETKGLVVPSEATTPVGGATPNASADPLTMRDGGWFFKGVEGIYLTAPIEGVYQTLVLFRGGAAQHELLASEPGVAPEILAASLSKLLRMQSAKWSIERDKVLVEGTSEQLGDIAMIFGLQSNGDLILERYGGGFGKHSPAPQRFIKQ